MKNSDLHTLAVEMLNHLILKADFYCTCTGSGEFNFTLSPPDINENWVLTIVKREDGTTGFQLFEGGDLFPISINEAIDACMTHIEVNEERGE